MARLAACLAVRDQSPIQRLLDGAANIREYIVGVRADEPDCADHDYQNYSQHHCIFGDILTTLIGPKVL
jgi:hypothetical protein